MRHCDPVTMDHIIELRKRVALLEKQLENALSYVRPLFEQQRKYLEEEKYKPARLRKILSTVLEACEDVNSPDRKVREEITRTVGNALKEKE